MQSSCEQREGLPYDFDTMAYNPKELYELSKIQIHEKNVICVFFEWYS